MTAAPPTSELAAFVTRMLDADEAAARAAQSMAWRSFGTDVLADWTSEQVADAFHPFDAAHIARHDPARVLAEVAALRAVVALRQAYGRDGMGDFRDGYTAALDDALRHVAAIWASDPAFDPAWSA